MTPPVAVALAMTHLEVQGSGHRHRLEVARDEEPFGGHARRQDRLVHRNRVEQARGIRELRREAIVGHDHPARGLGVRSIR